jgi:hypothetical protein
VCGHASRRRSASWVWHVITRQSHVCHALSRHACGCVLHVCQPLASWLACYMCSRWRAASLCNTRRIARHSSGANRARVRVDRSQKHSATPTRVARTRARRQSRHADAAKKLACVLWNRDDRVSLTSSHQHPHTQTHARSTDALASWRCCRMPHDIARMPCVLSTAHACATHKHAGSVVHRCVKMASRLNQTPTTLVVWARSTTTLWHQQRYRSLARTQPQRALPPISAQTP